MLKSPPLAGSRYPVTEVVGVRFHCLTVCDLIDEIIARGGRNEQSVIGNVNVHALNLAWGHAWYRKFLNQCELVFCDGFGVLYAAWLTGAPIRKEHRMTCPDYFDRLVAECRRTDRSLFLLGETRGGRTSGRPIGIPVTRDPRGRASWLF